MNAYFSLLAKVQFTALLILYVVDSPRLSATTQNAIEPKAIAEPPVPA